jgi:hypothetical protein
LRTSKSETGAPLAQKHRTLTAKPSALEWALIAAWTVVFCFFLLWPSKGTLVDGISEIFGGAETTDAVGHTGLTFMETLVLDTVMRHYTTRTRAFFAAIACSLLLGLVLEVAQIWIPTRGFTVMDLAANWLGAGLFALLAGPYVLRKSARKGS